MEGKNNFDRIKNLEATRMKYKGIFDHIKSGVAVYEAVDNGDDFVFVDINRSSEKIEGLKRENAIGKRVTEIFPGIKAFGLFKVFQRVYRTGKPEDFEDAHYEDERIEGWRSNSVFKIPTGEIVAVYDDLTEKKQMEQELEKNRYRLKTAEKIAHLGSWEMDLKTGKTIWSDEFFRICGYEPGEIEPAKEKGVALIHPDDRKKAESALEKALREKSDYAVEKRIVRPDGSIRHIYSQGEILTDQDGEARRLIGSFLDITERKQAMIKTENAMKKAKEANRAKSAFLANMSHEIRTPLNGIVGFTDLLLTTSLNATQRDYIKNIQNSSIILLDLINDILDFSKIEAGKLEIEKSEFNLFELLERTIEVVRLQAHEKGLEMLFNFSPEIPDYVITDQTRLRQILINFLSNSLKFTDEGEIELKCLLLNLEPERKKVTLAFSVRDTGRGIPADKQKKIFDSFTQEDDSTTRKYGGTGLGLAISKNLIEKLGGTLTLESEPGKGSVFSFRIDFDYTERVSESSEAVTLETVLIVDDNENNLKILGNILKHWNIKSLKAKNGLEALSVMEKSRDQIDLVIMDYSMPYMNGIETIEKMRQELELKQDEKPFIILYTSVENQEISKKGEALSISRKILKPATMSEIYNVITSDFSIPGPETADNAEPAAFEANYSDKQTILIVEDNKVNRVLLRKYLKQFGDFNIIEALNGREAVEQFRKNGEFIDLIIMDVQMPEMNGYDASLKIRELEAGKDGKNNRVPIVALTARVLKGESKNAERHGMDEYLSKPIRIGSVAKLLKRYLREKADEEETDDHYDSGHSQNAQIEAYLQSMNLQIDEIREIEGEYLKEVQSNLKKLQKAFGEENADRIRSVAHSIKGSSSNVGNNEIEKIARRIENAAKAGKLETVSTYLGELKKALKKFENYFSENIGET